MKKFKVLKNNMVKLLDTSFPLIGSMLSGLIMMLVDRLCLARYSQETLAASGPAIYNAITIITFFVGIAGITRVFVGQANGKKDEYNIAMAALSGIIISVALGVIFIMGRPLMMLIPELSGRPEVIKGLEKEFMGVVPYYGFFMILNSGIGSILNGILKTKITMAVGVISNVLNAIFTILFVYGFFGFPQLGMRGSAYGTLIASATGTVVYVIVMARSEILKPAFEKQTDKHSKIIDIAKHMLKIGMPSGASQALDEAGQAAFVSIVGSVSVIGLMANNVALAINYIIIIPLIGLGTGTSIIIANKIGSKENEQIFDILKAAFAITFVYIVVMTVIELIFASKLVIPFMPDGTTTEQLNATISVVKVLFMYAVGFAFSMIMGGALEAVGLSKYIFWIRVLLVWGISLPIIYFIVKRNMNNTGIVQICWVILSGFELVLGLIYGALFFWKGHKQETLIK